MDSDISLLKFAAKAAGIEYVVGFYCRDRGLAIVGERGSDINYWNPRNDDGDSQRLAVKLGLDIDRTAQGWVVVRLPGSPIAVCLAVDPDPYDATRLAILRAAAEIGKHMKD